MGLLGMIQRRGFSRVLPLPWWYGYGKFLGDIKRYQSFSRSVVYPYFKIFEGGDVSRHRDGHLRG